MFQVLLPRVAKLQLGALCIYQLYDGMIDHTSAYGFFGLNADEGDFQALSNEHKLETGRFDFPVTVTLVEVDGQRILIDAGHGSSHRPSAGQLPLALAEAGIEPSSIDTVIITHLHRDHIGGLLDEMGRPFFTKARHLVRQCEHDYWLETRADYEIRKLAERVIGTLSEQLEFAEPGQTVAHGITLLDSAGHTPGHMCVALESDGERLIVASDLANHPVWSIMRPHWHMRLDWDGPMAAHTRSRLLGQIADEALLMAGYHMPFPAIGHIQREGAGFLYSPINAG